MSTFARTSLLLAAFLVVAGIVLTVPLGRAPGGSSVPSSVA